MLMIAQCPRCNEEVLLPARVRSEARVRCPHCQEEYLLADAMRKLPPALIVLDADDGGWDQAGSADSPGYAGFAYDGSSSGRGGPAVMEAPSGLDTAVEMALEPAESDESSVATAPAAPRPMVRTSPRPKPRQKSVVMEGVKIVLGGAVGLFVAQLILWWGFHNDAFDIAPTLAKNGITRMLLPEALRRAPTPDAGSGGNQGAATPGAPSSVAQGTSSGAGFNNKVNWNDVVGGKGDGTKTGTGSPGKSATGKAAGTNDGNAGGDQLVADIDPFGEKSKPGKSDPFDLKLDQPGAPAAPSLPNEPELPLPTPESPKPANPSVENPTPDSPSPAKPAAASRVKGLAVRPAADMGQAVAQATAAREKLSGVDRTNRDEFRSAAEALYEAATTIAEAVTAADSQDAEYAAQSGQVAEFVRGMVADSLQSRMIDALSPAVLDAEPSATPQGIVLQGVVTSLKTQGEMSLATIKLSTKEERFVSVVRIGEFPEGFATDAKVVVLGVVVHDPAKQLTGYADEETRVVYAGLSVVPPAPAVPAAP